jgi:acyl carrier protein
MVTSEQDLRDQIKKIFSDNLSVEVATDDTDLLENQLLDSMGIVDLLMHIEQHFGVTIGLEDLEIEDFRSVGKIASKVSSRLQEKNGKAGSPHAA